MNVDKTQILWHSICALKKLEKYILIMINSYQKFKVYLLTSPIEQSKEELYLYVEQNYSADISGIDLEIIPCYNYNYYELME